MNAWLENKNVYHVKTVKIANYVNLDILLQ